MKFEYKFANRIYTNFEQLGKDISESWELAKIQLYSGAFHKAVADIDPVLGNKIHVCQNILTKDRGVFVLQYLFNSNLPFCYKGLTFEELSEIGKKMLDTAPNIDPLIEEIVRHGLIGDYMKLKELDKNYANHYKQIREIEDRYENEGNVAYFLMAFLLSEDKGFYFEDRNYVDEKALFTYLLNSKKVEQLAQIEENIDYLTAWLEVQGHQMVIGDWQEKVNIIKSWK